MITATNRDLESAIAGGAFRKDLFYRLNVFPIETPPLRERKADIPTLVEYFIHRYARKAGKRIGTIEKSTLEQLESYSPGPGGGGGGNIRELQNVIERSVIVWEADPFSVDPSWLSLESSSVQSGSLRLAEKATAQERRGHRDSFGGDCGPRLGTLRCGRPTPVCRASTLESKIRSPEDQQISLQERMINNI